MYNNLHKANGYIVDEVIKFGAVEDGVVSKVMLEPASLSLACDNENSRYQPRQPVIAKVPQDPPAQNMEENNMSEEGYKEPWLHFEHPLYSR